MSAHQNLAYLLIFFLFAISIEVEANRAGGPRLKFCDYIFQIGIHNNPHCPPKGMGRSIKMRDDANAQEDSTINNAGDEQTTSAPQSGKTPGYKSCFLKFNPNNCLRSDFCDSKLLCVDVVGNPCCVAQGVCPTKQQLDVKCVRTKPTNWCNQNADCGLNSLCCDTGCGYNICYKL